MALDDLSSTYPGKADAPSAAYPQGRIRNPSGPSAGDETPVDELWLNDIQGFLGALLSNASSVSASGSADTATASDFYTALTRIVRDAIDNATVGYQTQYMVYRDQTFDPGSEATSGASAVEFKTDGSKMYISAVTLGEIFEYDLGTEWDVSTAVYNGVSFDVSSQSSNMLALRFKPDGTKAWMLADGTSTVYQYSLSTAWDLSTASYDSVSFDASTQDPDMVTMAFKTDGTKLYLLGVIGADQIHQYSLSTAWDLSTASYDSVSVDVQTGMGPDTIWGMDFAPDGETLMLVNNDTGTTAEVGPHQYSLSTAWDISTATYTGNNFDVTGAVGAVADMKFPASGARMYILGTGDVFTFNAGITSGGY